MRGSNPMIGAEFELTLRANQDQQGSYFLEVRLRNGTIEMPVTGARVVIDEKRLDDICNTGLDNPKESLDYGQALAEMLFVPELLGAWRRARDRANRAGEPLRVRLMLDATIAALHRLRWELLCDPDSLPQSPAHLLKSERIFFPRCLPSSPKTFVQIRRPHELSALIAVAGPLDVAGYHLDPVVLEVEIARARAGLGSMPLTLLPDQDGRRATLNGIVFALTENPPTFFTWSVTGGCTMPTPPSF